MSFRAQPRNLGSDTPPTRHSRESGNPERVGASSKWVGVDGCKAGWFSIGFDGDGAVDIQCEPDFADIVSYYSQAELILVDMPIGLPDGSTRRECDLEARRLLLEPRRRSVFPTPTRRAVEHIAIDPLDWDGAIEIQQSEADTSLQQQVLGIMRKIAQVDEIVLNYRNSDTIGIREIHPELLFWALNGQRSMTNNKSTPEGILERVTVLQAFHGTSQFIFDTARQMFPRQVLDPDDVLDALAAAVTAWKCHDNLRSIPQEPQFDVRGLPMEMVFCQ